MKVLTNIDMNKNEVQNVCIQKVATLPATGVEGQLIYLTAGNEGLYQNNGTEWKLVGSFYDLSFGAVASNSIPLKLVGSDGTTDTVNIKGAGGATLSLSGSTLTISTANTNTTYTFAGVANATGYVVTCTPSSGAATTVTIPLATASLAGLLSPAEKTKLGGIATGANNYVHPTADGSHHVPATGTTNSGKVLKAGATAGSEAWGTLTKADVGLGNVSNTSDMDKPVSTAQAAALSIKAPLASPALTGSPTAPTPTGNTGIANKGYVDTAVANGIAASDAMIFKGTLGTGGTITALPTTYKTGWTYMVTTAGTYAGNVCEMGDLIVALVDRAGTGNVNADWTVAQTNINGAITNITGTSPIIVTGSGSSRTIELANSGVTAGTYGEPDDLNPAFGVPFNIPSIEVDSKGRVIGIKESVIELPMQNLASAQLDGLMSKENWSALLALNTAPKRYKLKRTIEAGQTSVSAQVTQHSYFSDWTTVHACIASTQEPVMVDFSFDADLENITVSISNAYAEDIYVMIAYWS